MLLTNRGPFENSKGAAICRKMRSFFLFHFVIVQSEQGQIVPRDLRARIRRRNAHSSGASVESVPTRLVGLLVLAALVARTFPLSLRKEQYVTILSERHQHRNLSAEEISRRYA